MTTRKSRATFFNSARRGFEAPSAKRPGMQAGSESPRRLAFILESREKTKVRGDGSRPSRPGHVKRPPINNRPAGSTRRLRTADGRLPIVGHPCGAVERTEA
jgi:hypothetical protein